MKNIASFFSEFFIAGESQFVGVVQYQLGDLIWRVDNLSGTVSRVEGSGVSPGDYVKHNGVSIERSFGPVDFYSELV